MITNSQIKKLFEQWQKDEDIFLVDIAIKPGNKIVILIDKISGLNISDCVDLSRHIEGNLDREKEDFELSVSSPGADAPFKVLQQYQKNLGRKVRVLSKDDKIITGKLSNIHTDIIEIEPEVKSKNKLVVPVNIDINNIKEIRVIISFK
ncbi:MAG TPA: ribosome assembly cofactor RimP [Bacteroidia bacterium]|nr:ribosome assembly cofactor RimP [Bacteroidia bacterium]